MIVCLWFQFIFSTTDSFLPSLVLVFFYIPFSYSVKTFFPNNSNIIACLFQHVVQIVSEFLLHRHQYQQPTNEVKFKIAWQVSSSSSSLLLVKNAPDYECARCLCSIVTECSCAVHLRSVPLFLFNFRVDFYPPSSLI